MVGSPEENKNVQLYKYFYAAEIFMHQLPALLILNRGPGMEWLGGRGFQDGTVSSKCCC